jgi:KaiC/GvpD/RAD55 family RecA-like ATPase
MNKETNTQTHPANEDTYRLIGLDELYSQSFEMDWLIEDILPNNSVGMLYGPSGSGKSHVALSMAVSVANGSDWFGHETKQGTVMVLAGEGLSGLSRRLKAIEKQTSAKIDQSRFFVSQKAIGLDTEDGFKQALKAIDSLSNPPSLVIIDTLSRHLLESTENSNDDMARFINKLEAIRERYKCAVLLVHHTGKATDQGARGASSLRANIDFSYVLSSEKDKHCKLACDKMKDADDSLADKMFEIVAVELEKNQKGKTITGACIIKSDKTFLTGSKKPKVEDEVLKVFNANKATWQENYLKTIVSDSASDDSKKKRFREAVKKLVEQNKVKETSRDTYEKVEIHLDSASAA